MEHRNNLTRFQEVRARFCEEACLFLRFWGFDQAHVWDAV